MAVAGLSSTLSLTNRTSSRSSDISSRIGETRRQGTHHGAQKSTMTGFSDLRTSLSNVASVTSATAMLQKTSVAQTPASQPRYSSTTEVALRGRPSLRPALLEAAGEDL